MGKEAFDPTTSTHRYLRWQSVPEEKPQESKLNKYLMDYNHALLFIMSTNADLRTFERCEYSSVQKWLYFFLLIQF